MAELVENFDYFFEFTIIIFSSFIYSLLIKELYKLYFVNESSNFSLQNSLPMIAASVSTIFWLLQYSLPLSLGLLGALSFVRYRVPIKKSEDIAFILLIIAVGLSNAVLNLWIGPVLIVFLFIYIKLKDFNLGVFNYTNFGFIISISYKNQILKKELDEMLSSIENFFIITENYQIEEKSLLIKTNKEGYQIVKDNLGKLETMDSNLDIEISSTDFGLGSGESRFDDALENNFDDIAKIFTDETQGIATRLYDIADEYASSGGLISSREKAAKDNQSQIDDARARLEQHMLGYEAMVRAKYLNLDQTVSRLNQTGSALLASLGSYY